MRDKNKIEINVDEAKMKEMFKKTFQRFEEKMNDCGHDVCGCNVTGRTPAEQKFLNKLTVGVCAIAVLIMWAAYHLFPIIN